MADEPNDPFPPRRHARTKVALLVQYRFDTFGDYTTEYSVDLSPGGIFLRSQTPPSLGAVVYLQFAFKGGSRLIEGLGKVAWISPRGADNPGFGVEFIQLDQESRALLDRLCQDLPVG